MAEKGAVWGGRERAPSQRRGSSQGSPGGGPSRAERQVGWFLSKDAPEGGGDHDAQDHTADDDHDLLLHGRQREASESVEEGAKREAEPPLSRALRGGDRWGAGSGQG